MYSLFFHLILRWLPAELAHRLGHLALRFLVALPGLASWLGRLLRPRAEALRVRALGLEFASPVGMAAGFDKDGEVFEGLAVLGFGHVEVGTITGQPQPGNPKPRLFRLPRDHALLNRMGFNNHGAAAAAERLGAARRGGNCTVPLGVNIGKTKVVPAEEAASDYVFSAERLGQLADYVVVNVSSPNTPGLRDLQSVEKLRPLLAAVREALDRARGEGARRVPLLVKIAPDLADEEIDAIADLVLELGLDGIVACNTTLSRAGLATPPDTVTALGAGGISGKPVQARSLAILRRLRARVGKELVLISVGGIETADDAWERLRAGATLLQVYTGFIYQGPLMLARLHRGLLDRLRGAGLDSVAEIAERERAA